MLAPALSWIGGIGAVVAAVCCFTGLLPLALGAVGLSALTPALYRDAVLFPALGAFLIIMGAGLWLRRKTR